MDDMLVDIYPAFINEPGPAPDLNTEFSEQVDNVDLLNDPTPIEDKLVSNAEQLMNAEPPALVNGDVAPVKQVKPIEQVEQVEQIEPMEKIEKLEATYRLKASADLSVLKGVIPDHHIAKLEALTKIGTLSDVAPAGDYYSMKWVPRDKGKIVKKTVISGQTLHTLNNILAEFDAEIVVGASALYICIKPDKFYADKEAK